jgi:hypothetical protein
MARSVVVLDVKQENWDATAGFRLKNLRQTTLLFNPLDAAGRTCRYNPFSHIDRRDEVDVINELQKIGAMLFPPPQTGDSFGPKARGQHSWALQHMSRQPPMTGMMLSPSPWARSIASLPPAMPSDASSYHPPARGSGQTAFGGLRLSAPGLVHCLGQHVHLDPTVRHGQDQSLAQPLCRCGDGRERL